jgi:hypothetical protein
MCSAYDDILNQDGRCSAILDLDTPAGTILPSDPIHRRVGASGGWLMAPWQRAIMVRLIRSHSTPRRNLEGWTLHQRCPRSGPYDIHTVDGIDTAQHTGYIHCPPRHRHRDIQYRTYNINTVNTTRPIPSSLSPASREPRWALHAGSWTPTF